MLSDEPTAVVRRFYAGLNAGDEAVVDRLIAPNFAYNGQVIGRDGVKEHMRATRAAFPDLHWTIEDMFADGERVVTRYTYSGTHEGDLMGIPATGKPFASPGIAIDRITGGLLVEEWEVRDTLGAFQQLGVIPGPGAN